MIRIERHSLLSLLALSVIILTIFACGGDEGAKVDIPTASTPAVDTLKSTPNIQVQDSSRLSIDDYLAICGGPETETAGFVEGRSLEEFSAALGDFTKQLESVEPPAEVADWHDAVLAYQMAAKESLDDYPTAVPRSREVTLNLTRVPPSSLMRSGATSHIQTSFRTLSMPKPRGSAVSRAAQPHPETLLPDIHVDLLEGSESVPRPAASKYAVLMTLAGTERTLVQGGN